MNTALTWQGSVLASGYIFDEALIGRAELLRRLQALWSDGARLARASTRWYLLGATPLRVDTRASLGAPLVRTEGRWLMGPRVPSELNAAPVDAVLETVAGAMVVTPFHLLSAAHPAELVQLRPPQLLETRSLAPPPAKLVIGKATPNGNPTVDSVFAPMLEAVVGAAPPAPVEVVRPSAWSRFTRWLSGAEEAEATPPRDPPQPVAPAQPGFLSQALARIFAGNNPKAQQAYLDDLRARFLAGDLSEALRRAVPLSDAMGARAAAAPTGGIPARRESLSLFGPRVSGAPSMVMPQDEFGAMKKMYREAAERLIADGKIDEAAYVLSRLLNDGLAAVALLEKHQRFELAAQLATAHHLPEVDRIRLWLLAGNTREAVRIARISGNFSALVSSLSSRSVPLARDLRVLWGEFLASRQRFAEAISVTSMLPTVPEQWATWLDGAIDAGGDSAVTALAVETARHPADAQHSARRLAGLLEATPRLTSTAAEALLTHAPQAPRHVYRDVWRRLVRGASDGTRVDSRLVERVLSSAGDQALAVDSVKVPTPALVSREPLELAPPVVTQLAALDVAALTKGRRAIAHGAAGLRVVGPTGQTLRHLLVKADQLVAGPVGSQVLVISRDGLLTRVWKLDPVSFELTSWFQTSELEAWSRRTDGLSWAVGMQGALVLLDPAAPAPMEWWRVANLKCEQLDALGPYVVATGLEAPNVEPRTVVFHAEEQRLAQRITAGKVALVKTEILHWVLTAGEGGDLLTLSGSPSRTTRVPHGPWKTLTMTGGLVLTRLVAQATEVWVVHWAEFSPRLVARFAGTQRASVTQLTVDRFAVCDEHGRVTEFDFDG